jgi:inosose dehydratase
MIAMPHSGFDNCYISWSRPNWHSLVAIFMGSIGVAVVAAAISKSLAQSAPAMPELACNVYPWMTFYQRAGRDLEAEMPAALAELATTGFTSFEPILHDRSSVDTLAELLPQHGLKMRSAYMNSELHHAEKAAASVDHVRDVSAYAKAKLGTDIIVTNPSPISWGGPENKDDAEIRTQAKALDKLGAGLRAEGITLAYHNHDSELRMGAREFHHMLVATDPANVKFCLDSHWIFRGCGDSSVALFDAVELYADRVVELHLRQSTGGVWGETFSAAGDIDYGRLFEVLAAHGAKPLLVMEQAVEDGSPTDHDAVSAHRASFEALRAMMS